MKYLIFLLLSAVVSRLVSAATSCESNKRLVTVTVSSLAPASFKWDFFNIDNPLDAQLVQSASGSLSFCVKSGSEYVLVVMECDKSTIGSGTVRLKLDQVLQWRISIGSIDPADVFFVSVPYVTAAPTAYTCGSSQCMVQIDLEADGEPNDISWSLSNATSSGSFIIEQGKSSDKFCVSSGYYNFLLVDCGEDGLNSDYVGDYSLWLDSTLLRSKGVFSTVEGYFFECSGSSKPPTPAPTPEIEYDPQTHNLVTVLFSNPTNPSQNTWSISDALTGDTVYEQFGAVNGSVLLSCGKTYIFRVADSYGDGLGTGGSFSVRSAMGGRKLVPSNGASVTFEYSYTEYFNVSCGTVGSPTPSPSASPTSTPVQTPSSQPSSSPSMFPTAYCDETQFLVRVKTSIVGAPTQNHTWRFYGLGRDNTINRRSLYAESTTICAERGYYVFDFTAPSTDSLSTFEVHANGLLACQDTMNSNRACLLTLPFTASPTIGPSQSPISSPSSSPSSSPIADTVSPTASYVAPITVSCPSGYTSVTVLSSKTNSFTWNWISYNPNSVYSATGSQANLCVVMGSSNVIIVQTAYLPLPISITYGTSGPFLHTVVDKTFTVWYP